MAVIGPNDQQPGVLALRAGVRLQRDRREARDLCQPALQLMEELLVPARLHGRGEGMDAAEALPGDGDHLHGGVELHRAGAQRDHRMHQREVPRLQAVHVPEHLVLGVIPVEDFVREVLARPRQRWRERVARLGSEVLHGEGHRPASTEDLEERLDLRRRGHLVQRDAKGAVLELPQIDTTLLRHREHACPGMLVRPDVNGVEERLAAELVAHAAQAIGEHRREAMHALRDPPQSFRPVVHRVHAGHHGQQYLGRADVARRLVTADVLLARLQGQPVGRLPVGVP